MDGLYQRLTKLVGLYNYLQKRKDAGTLKDLAGEDGEIHCVFICCDLPYQYLDDYFVKLGESHFHPIQNNASSFPPRSFSGLTSTEPSRRRPPPLRRSLGTHPLHRPITHLLHHPKTHQLPPSMAAHRPPYHRRLHRRPPPRRPELAPPIPHPQQPQSLLRAHAPRIPMARA